jgi:hypothetical protein
MQQPLRVIIGDSTVTAAQAHLSDWMHASESANDGNARELDVQMTRDGQFTVINLELFTSSREQLLTITATFREGVVNYMWRLHPRK